MGCDELRQNAHQLCFGWRALLSGFIKYSLSNYAKQIMSSGDNPTVVFAAVARLTACQFPLTTAVPETGPVKPSLYNLANSLKCYRRDDLAKSSWGARMLLLNFMKCATVQQGSLCNYRLCKSDHKTMFMKVVCAAVEFFKNGVAPPQQMQIHKPCATIRDVGAHVQYNNINLSKERVRAKNPEEI